MNIFRQIQLQKVFVQPSCKRFLSVIWHCWLKTDAC